MRGDDRSSRYPPRGVWFGLILAAGTVCASARTGSARSETIRGTSRTPLCWPPIASPSGKRRVRSGCGSRGRRRCFSPSMASCAGRDRPHHRRLFRRREDQTGGNLCRGRRAAFRCRGFCAASLSRRIPHDRGPAQVLFHHGHRCGQRPSLESGDHSPLRVSGGAHRLCKRAGGRRANDGRNDDGAPCRPAG